MKRFPELFHKTSKGNINVWNVWADDDTVFTRWGKQDGKMQESSFVVEQKNVGKANETSLVEQAEFEAQALWTHKLERKYVETLEETEDRIFLPMLAKSFEKRKKKIKAEAYPVWCQPKLDGVRCLAFWGKSGRVELMSRSGKTYHLPHITEALESFGLPDDDVLDGELYLHGTTLQQLNRLVRGSHKYPESVTVEYHVYDYVIPDLADPQPWSVRQEFISDFFDGMLGGSEDYKVRVVGGRNVVDEKDVYAYHAECRENGYEGSIVRFYHGEYKFGYRSSELLKVKSFMDEEFQIVDYGHGIGKFAKCVIYTCITADGKRFAVVPKGTFEERAVWLEEADSVIGEMLKVEFADWTEDNIPQFPIGICIRMPEDM